MPTPQQLEQRHAQVRNDAIAAAHAKCAARRGQMWAGNDAVQRHAEFFEIKEPVSPPRKALRSGVEPFVPTRPQRPQTVKRDGPHVGFPFANPLAQAPLDPLKAKELKVKDPVQYHVYTHQRPWVTQSGVIGEHLREGHATARIPQSAPVGASKREALKALRLTSSRAVGDNSKPGDLEAVSPTRQGFIASAPRQEGDMTTVSQRTFVDVRKLPEPATCKARAFQDKPFHSKHPTDTAARDAVDSMWQPDGSLSAERPSGVHESVWRLVQQRDKAMSLGDPHAHKRHAPGWLGTTLSSTSGRSVVA